MRAIALSLAVTLWCCSGALADPHSEVVDLFAGMASALGDENTAGFMKPVDKDMPGYNTLRNQIDALLLGATVSSDVEPIKDDGNDTRRTVQLDWFLQIRSRQADGPLVQRRQIITCELERQKKGWRIVSLKPIAFFAPPDY
jgi:hypothetical protein